MRRPVASSILLNIIVMMGYLNRLTSAFGLPSKRHSLKCLSSYALRTSAPELELVPPSDWRADAAAHRERVRRLVGGSLAGFDGDHPIYNFIFRYYFWKPQALATYSPGYNRVLLEATPAEINHSGGQRQPREYSLADERGLYFDASLCSAETLLGFKNTRDLLVATERRPPVLNCFGFHEWAMLYDKAPAGSCATCASNEAKSAPGATLSRHQRLPLRLSQDALNAVVESRAPLKCTHFDAFRFFTEGAVPLNEQAGLSRDTQAAHEQPGCVHASMDLFKYAMKLVPWVNSALVGDILELAVAARTLDMRASPYDLTAMTPSQRRVCCGPAPGSEPSAALEDTPLVEEAPLESSLGAVSLSREEREIDASKPGLEEIYLDPVAAARLARKAKRKKLRSKAQLAKAASAAREGRSHKRDVFVDMDVSPILVETVEGRQQYKWEQEKLWKRAAPLRRRLIESYDGFLTHALALHA